MKPKYSLGHLLIFSFIAFMAGWNFATPCHAAEPLAPTANIQTFASYLAGQDVIVRCQSEAMDGMEGYTNFVNGKALPDIYLRADICLGIGRLLHHRVTNALVQGDDLETLLHEATHIRLNLTNEGVTECVAMHQVRGAVALLGFNRATRQRLVRGAWRMHYRLPSWYRTVC